MNFIEKISPLIQKYAPQYGIRVCSPIIAQACLESAYGTSGLAKVHNYFGLKYRAGRCPTACGTCYKTGSEQRADGSYESSVMEWCKFQNMESGVQGYFDFINVARYANLKGVTDPQEYLEKIKTDGYATSLKYVDNLMAVIKKYDLTKYDTIGKVEEEKKGMKILLSVGHSILRTGQCTSADGRPFGGVLEYAYNKAIVEDVAAYLHSVGHTVDLLICPELRFSKSSEEKSYKLNYENAGNYDLAAELHLNASALHNARGCEVLYLSDAGKAFARQIQTQLATVFKDRGIQKRDNLYMLTKTKAPAVIIESFFCDSSADCELAEKTDVALLIAQGIHGGEIGARQDKPVVTGMLYKVQAGAFRRKENADRLVNELHGKGIDAIVTTVDMAGLIYRVQVGAYSVKANAEAMQEKMHNSGYNTCIVAA